MMSLQRISLGFCSFSVKATITVGHGLGYILLFIHFVEDCIVVLFRLSKSIFMFNTFLPAF